MHMAPAKRKTVDRPFLISTILLLIAGFFIFTSASMGLLARTENIFKSTTFNQIILGLLGGIIAMIITSYINYKQWARFALPIYVASIVVLLLLFIPGIGFGYNGATRWIHVGPLSFQPSEIYKICSVIFIATWLAHVKTKVTTWKFGTLPILIFIFISGALILSQPDTATFGITVIAAIGMYVAAGARWRDIFLFAGIGIIGLTVLAFTRPYIMDRIHTFIDPSRDSIGSGYQIQQSMIAIGSGQILGKGFGQSVQKFSFLPESNSDSVFAVAGEEFGFVGCVLIIFLYVVFTLRGFKIAARAPDQFSRLMTIGIVILIISGSFINIASMLGLIPISGVPLIFMSKGGTALFITLAQVGIVLNISRYQTA